MKHKYSCGCTIQKGEEINKSCPDHEGSVIVERFIFCIDCGAKRFFKSPTSGHDTIRCFDCQKIFNNFRMKEWRKYNTQNQYSKKRYDKKADIDKRSKCAKIMKCLDKYSYYNNIPCKPCHKFVEQDFSVDVMNARRDFTERTRL